MKLVCPDCGRQYESGKFCLECGGKLQEVTIELVCPSCGYKAKSGKFCPECGAKLTEQVATANEVIEQNSVERTFNERGLPMDLIRKAAEASYPKKTLKELAVAALKIAEVIQEKLPNAEVSYMVHPSEFDTCVNKDALPIHFLFKKNGVPKVAVVAVTVNGHRTPLVLATADACRRNGIEYVKVYANGPYADWIEGWSLVTNSPVSNKTVEFCKKWLVEKIESHL